MLAHLIEASVMFQNGTIWMMYAGIFATLGILCLVNYLSSLKGYVD